MTKITSFDGEHVFLSNFAPSEVELDGDLYPTVEHAFQAAKTRDPKQRRAIRKLAKPSLAKTEGREVDMMPGWDNKRLGVMEALVRQKFTRHPDLAEQLLATGDAELVEGNTWGDTFWGVYKGQGQNHLGKILMRVRAELQKTRR